MIKEFEKAVKKGLDNRGRCMVNIGFYRAGLIGDNVIVLHALYALRHLYRDSNIVVYTNDFGVNLYAQFNFIDSIINVDSFDDSTLANHINENSFDVFLLTQPNRAKCALLEKTNAKRIITFMTFSNSFNRRFETIFISRNFNNIPQYKRMLKLVRKIDSKHYDSNIGNIDYTPPPIRFKSGEKNRATIQAFIESNDIKGEIVLVNPFVRSAGCNLTLSGYEILLNKLSSAYKNLHFVIPTYKDNAELSNIGNLKNVSVFNNDSDLINLVALLEKSIALISPSTGISHIANNLNTPLIWLCGKRDSHLWAGDNMDSNLFVILHSITRKITREEELKAIDEVLEKFSYLIQRSKA